MFACCECGKLFKELAYWEETHGLDTPPYEQWSGSPCCYSGYTDAHKCDCCNEWIEGTYIKLDSGERICANCYTVYETGEED